MSSAATYPLSNIQKRLSQQNGPVSGTVSMRAAIEGPLEPARWSAAVQSVIRRHEIVRTRYQTPAGLTVPVQMVSDDTDWRFELVQAARDSYLFSVTVPAMSADAWTMRELLGDIARQYSGAAEAGDVLQYAQFASWLASIHSEQEPEAEDYWRKQLQVARQSQCFSFASSRHVAPASDFGYFLLSLTPGLQRAIVRTSDAAGAKPSDVVLCAWFLLLARHAAASDVTLGWLADGRIYEEFRGILGPFSSLVPLNLHIADDRSFRDVLKAVVETTEAAAAYQHHFDRESLRTDDVVFENRNLSPITTAHGLTIRLEDLKAEIVPFRIKLIFDQRAEEFDLSLAFDREAYSTAAIEELARQLLRTLEEGSSSPEKSCLRLNLLDAKTEELLKAWGRGASIDGGRRTIPDLIDAKASEYPAAPALVFRGNSTSYGELSERTNQLARLLQEIGVEPGDLVGILMDHSDTLILFMLAALKAGAAYLPLDPQYPPGRIRRVLEDSSCRLLITDRPQQAPELLPGLAVRDAGHLIDESHRKSGLPVPQRNREDSAAYVLYTSGSTGRPKGCEIGMSSLCNYVLWANDYYASYGAFGRFGLYTSISFDLTVTSIFCALTTGNPLYIYDAAEPLDAILSHSFSGGAGINSVKITPSHLRLLKESGIRPEGVQTVIIGGEALDLDLVEYLLSSNSRLGVFNEYGPTEATVGCIVKRIEAGDRRVLIGSPIWNTQIRILNEAGIAVPPGIAGELWIGGVPLARGYWKDGSMTGDRFVNDTQGARFYRTGDFARWMDNGEIDFLGRRDEQIKIRGNRVELGEIRQALVQLEGVRDALVLARPAGQAGLTIVAYLLTESGEEVAGAADRLRRDLPESMVPQILIPLTQFPVNANGKIDIHALPDPEEYVSRRAAEHVPPRNDFEQKIAEVWCSVLGKDRIGVHDNFFRSGGDSIRAIQAASRLRSRGLKLEIREVLEHPTIAELAVLARPDVKDVEDVNNAPVSGRIHLTPIQRKFFEEHSEHARHYNQSVELLVPASVDHSVLEIAVGAIVRHHDALRTAVRRNEGDVELEMLAAVSAPLLVEYDWRGQPVTAEQLEKAQAATHLSISPETGVMIRAALLKTDDETRLYVVAHHLVVDGLSWRILLEDLETACSQALSRNEIVLPPRTGSVQQWSSMLHRRRNDEFFLEELQYWAEIRSRDFARLPVDFDQGDNLFRSIRTRNEAISPDVTAALLSSAHQAYRTEIGDLLLTALANVIAARTRSRRTLVYVEGHGRDLLPDGPDVSRTVGWFTAKYPLALDLAGDDAGAQIKHVKEQLRRVPHRGNGYGVLRYLTDHEKTSSLDRNLEPQISFNYLGQVSAGEAPLFRVVPQALDNYSIHPDLSFRQDLSFTGIVQDGRLNIAVSYSRNRFRESTIERILHDYLECLVRLVEHCTGKTQTELTPSDIDYRGFDIEGMEKFIENLETS